jgi:hypothetical protein
MSMDRKFEERMQGKEYLDRQQLKISKMCQTSKMYIFKMINPKKYMLRNDQCKLLKT